MTACAACGTPNPPGGRFCMECGTSLAVVCVECGTPAAGGKFCMECGTPLSGRAGVASTPVSSKPVSERRVTSLLFADLVGFTPLSESRDPEAVRELLSAYFERARAVVERYGGTVEKFIGDAVCAVWGVPTAMEDDAERAVRAGLDLVSAVNALGDEVRIEGLEMRVGITTGAVAVTLGAVGEGMVAGDAVNTAARVQSAAGPGEVWVDDTTRSLTTASLAYESAGRHSLKGKSVPLELFRAVRTMAVVGGSQRVDGLEAPFVGRDRELRVVKELFHATAEERRARLVLVVGEPGIGKSRLAWEFEKYLDAITTRTTFWLRGRCLSYGQGVAGRVVAEMVRSLLRVSDDDEVTVVAALDERLERHVPEPADRDVLRPRLLALLGQSDEVFEQADLFACWRGFLEALTSDGSSVTAVVEDLQWADDGSLDFLEHLLDAARAPIMVLALARPDVGTRRPGIGTGRRSTTVFLDPLPDLAMGRLFDGLVSDLPPQLREELVERAEGVPLYAVETVRSLIDRDVVVAAGGHYVVDHAVVAALDLRALAPPASLHALLAARLDALTADERRVVQDGSVLGLSFTRTGLEALTPPDVDLDRALEGLRRKEILTVDSDPRSPERGSLRFVQALLRGVAYETLSRRDRKARHIAVAEHLAGVPEANSLAGVLAAHYLDAAAAVLDDSDVEALRAQAVRLLERAAEHANAVGAPLDALGHCQQLLALDAQDEVVLRACSVAVELVLRLGRRFETGMELVERGLAAAERLGASDSEEALLLRVRRSDLRAGLGERSDDVLDDARAVFAASSGRGDRVKVALQAVRTICLFTQIKGDISLAREVTLAAIGDVERFGDDGDFASVLGSMAGWFGMAGYRRLAALVRQASVRDLDLRDPTARAAFSNLAVSLLHDDPRQAVEASARGLESARVLGTHNLAAAGHLVIASVGLGAWDEARAVLLRLASDDQSELLDWETYVAAASALLAWVAADAGVLRPAVPEADQLDDPLVHGWMALRDAVEVALRQGASDGAPLAVVAVERMAELGLAYEDLPLALVLAVDLLVESRRWEELEAVTARLEQLPTGQRYRFAHAQLLRARAHLSMDRVPGLRAAVDVLDAMGAAYWAAAVRVELAEALLEGGDVDGSAAVANAAEPLLRDLAAVRQLGRLGDLRHAAAPAP